MISEILSYPIDINNNDKILIAVSGGPDSMALLDIVRRKSEKDSLDYAVAHINHSLRDEADTEENAVKEYCEAFNIPFYSKKVNLNDEEYKGLSTEEAGRVARYTFFNDLAEELSFNKLLTAHHLNDQVETVLMRLIRGSGPDGLIGIKEENNLQNLKIIRPFLSLSKEDLRQYCNNNSVKYFEDKSNKDNQYTRNYIRNEVIPTLEKTNQKAQENINRAVSLVKEQNQFADEILSDIINKWIEKDNIGVSILPEVFTDFDKLINESHYSFLSEESKNYLKREVIRKAIKLLDRSKDISKKNIEDVLEFFNSDNNGSINLPNNLLAIKNSGFYEIIEYGVKPMIFGLHKLPDDLQDNQVIFFPKNRMTLKVKHGLASDFNGVKKERDEVLLKSLEGIKGLTLRNRQLGDYIELPNTSFKKKLSRFMIDKKIPRFLRDSLPVLAIEDKVIWIPGYYIHKDFIVKSPVEKVTRLSLHNF